MNFDNTKQGFENEPLEGILINGSLAHKIISTHHVILTLFITLVLNFLENQRTF